MSYLIWYLTIGSIWMAITLIAAGGFASYYSVPKKFAAVIVSVIVWPIALVDFICNVWVSYHIGDNFFRVFGF
jgi:hypothetical protein